MKLSSELVADRATLSVQYQRTEALWRSDSDPPPMSVKRPAHSSRAPSLSQEVERILASHKGPTGYGPRPTPTPGSYRSTPPALERTSEVQPVAPRSSSTDHTSEVQPVAPRTPPDTALTPPAELKRSKG